ncbi:LacI family DNA-binding transcriptional regulator [Virgibacillus dakarensis]|uniref:HTH lacI-type domain-containing protein n=1 Tax=Lentibacillus populi TaxID=1827502 RepID=A0A9W5X7M9_9BACI|nr:LacI family DNA-binding transcriptional regulator [Virgibacillus dakarensis]MTW87342.1 LacI family DNA-binding transcriptional regulator [Virgibacillus dakarensis]GGB61171.1 hypothetical protein GCM10011409_43040 [Lentibacillus populi]
MANIHDIAKKVGVSVSTVSRVLNNHKYVSDEKRRAVQNVIDELNYTPLQGHFAEGLVLAIIIMR